MNRRRFLTTLFGLAAAPAVAARALSEYKSKVQPLLSFKGKTRIGSGIVYAPYIPLVTTTPRKLSAKWSVELEQDLQSFHSIKADSQLVARIDNELLKSIG